MSGVENFTPIGGASKDNGELSNIFNGSFDGQNHTISNLYIEYPHSSVGLFGVVNSASNTSPTIKNLTLDKANISGNSDVGGLVGSNTGYTIENCHITNSTVSGHYYDLKTIYPSVGGLVGYNYNSGTVKNCTASNNHVSGDSEISGLVGSNKGTIDG